MRDIPTPDPPVEPMGVLQRAIVLYEFAILTQFTMSRKNVLLSPDTTIERDHKRRCILINEQAVDRHVLGLGEANTGYVC